MSTMTNRNFSQSPPRSGLPNLSKTPPSQTSNGNASILALLENVYSKIRDPVLYFCRRVIFGPVQFKVLVSFVIIIIGSFLKTNDLAPASYFALKNNIFNRYFAKLGWAWTMGLLGPFIYLSLINTHNTFQILTRHLVRLLIATGLWYIITLFFVRLEEYTGYCKHEDMRRASRVVCLKGGHEWEVGVDFSGHTFLLLYALLIINEEVKSYDKGTKKIDQVNERTQQQQQQSSGDPAEEREQERWQIYSKLIRILYVLLAALTVLWEFMLLSTALYFHHTSHKIAAAIVAILCWYLTYYVWYRSDSPSLLYPSKPKE